MKYLDEFRDEARAAGIRRHMQAAAEAIDHPARIMEICGGHTVTICRYGIRALLPPRVTIVSGPGCPVCVTPRGVVDAAVQLVRDNDVTLWTFGDMLRVPGTHGSLRDMRGRGKVRMLYSPMQAVTYAERNPGKAVVLFGVGFETTVPTLATAVLSAVRKKLTNFSFLSAGKLTPPAMRALMEAKGAPLNAFIAPGHVTTIVGAEAYRFLERDYHVPCVVAGFELCDVLDALRRICRQLAEKRHEIEIEYGRSVHMEGNSAAQKAIDTVFTTADDEWRGLGRVPDSGYRLKDTFSSVNAWELYSLSREGSDDPPECRCGDVLRGICSPPECTLFGTGCTPEDPVGPCMVSSEGSCAAYYRFGE